MDEILTQLGYTGSPNFLQNDNLEKDESHAHSFRRAQELYGLQGVYVLRSNTGQSFASTPVIYVCEAKNDEEALRIHRKVWNQNIVPFLLVKSPRYLRLYKGFTYSGVQGDMHKTNPDTLANLELHDIAQNLGKLEIHSGDIDEGKIWETWGRSIQPDDRVDISLLKQLQGLGTALRHSDLDPQTAHALIGKYVYLRYLRDRDILSDRKLFGWEIDPDEVFKRNATVKAFDAVNQRLDEWLNGSVFPLPTIGNPYRRKHIQAVASAFFGDTQDGQLHLNFQRYDFSAIPTETLSSIYEQFLHAPTSDSKRSKGRQAAAHYTPLPLVDLTIGELERLHPIRKGMKVLDPSCGSGAFLVQCYRRLIEKERQTGRPLTPHKLKQLLTDQIFGVELHEDACKVAALNLILTLLDNVTPPDLESKRHDSFKLPNLLDTNIFHADFFNPNSLWAKRFDGHKFDWVVGNPPWKEVKRGSIEYGDTHVLNWISSHANMDLPATDNQLAEAFVWKIRDLLDEHSLAGLVLPAMSLMKHDKRFRVSFLSKNTVHSVINLANLRKVLFRAPGKLSSASSPAAVVCFQLGEPSADHTIRSYAPFAIDQISCSRLSRRTAWSMTLNSSDLLEIPAHEVSDGSHLPWKVAMWGSKRDLRLLRKMERKLNSFDELRSKYGLIAHEGFQLRRGNSIEAVEHLPELERRKSVDFKRLRDCGRIFCLPESALVPINAVDCYVRKGRGRLPNDVSTPPHILVDAARRFAVFSDEWFAIPARQIGIAGGPDKADLLKAIAVYLSSDFVKYQQFLTSTEWGVKSDRATLQTLHDLPVPDALLDEKTVKVWASMYDSLADKHSDEVSIEFNRRIAEALQLGESESILVADLVNHRLKLRDGKIPKELSEKPTQLALRHYLLEFRRVLDSFVGPPYVHEITLQYNDKFAVLQVHVLKRNAPIEPRIVSADSELSDAFQEIHNVLRIGHSQWLYFDRCLKIYDGTSMYVFKPLQMAQWLRSKALRDADDVIAEYLATEG